MQLQIQMTIWWWDELACLLFSFLLGFASRSSVSYGHYANPVVIDWWINVKTFYTFYQRMLAGGSCFQGLAAVRRAAFQKRVGENRVPEIRPRLPDIRPTPSRKQFFVPELPPRSLGYWRDEIKLQLVWDLECHNMIAVQVNPSLLSGSLPPRTLWWDDRNGANLTNYCCQGLEQVLPGLPLNKGLRTTLSQASGPLL